MIYKVRLQKSEEGYSVSCPGLPGCWSQGETEEEALENIRDAIQEYITAAEITPNLTFLYLRIGLVYRQLQVYNTALEYFEKAATINQQLGIQDPLPYIAIAKTYAQQGEFFIASRNAEKALSFDPSNPNTYGQLGIIYIKSRNYEGALPALRCAVKGCSADENEVALRFVDEGILEESLSVEGLPLTNLTVAYYYVEYGTVMAFLSRPTQNYCSEAQLVLDEVRLKYSSDPILMSIVEDSEGICRRLASEGSSSQAGSSTPGTPSAPDTMVESTPTP